MIDTEFQNEFKLILKELRTDKGMGQDKLAKELGVNRGNISFWENGIEEPKMRSLILLAKYFNVSTDYLVGLRNDFGKINLECKKQFKDVLKELRTDKHLGQAKLAKELGVSDGIISLWETGQREPTMRSLILLAKYFDVSIDYLVGLSDD